MSERQSITEAILEGILPSLTTGQAHFEPAVGDETEDAAHILKVATAIQEGRYQDAVEATKPLDHESQRTVRNFFSRHVLRDKQLEWTGHGVNRTFRFWSDVQKKEYLQFAMKALDRLSQRYEAVLGYGSVLSIVRDNDLIPHDDDLDIIVSVNKANITTYKEELQSLHRYMEEAGFKVRGDYVAHRHVSDGKYMVDVFLGLQEDEMVSWHPGPRKVLLADSVFPCTHTTLFGVECQIPRDPENYLAVVYGEDWRTPLPGWTHDFGPSRYADWFWPKPKPAS